MGVESGDIFRVVVGIDMPDEQFAANVIGLQCVSGTGTTFELLTSAAAWVSALYANIATVVSTSVDLGEARLLRMTWSGTEWETAEVMGTFTPTFTSSSGVDMLPHAVAATVTLPTLNPRRKGKVKVAGLSETSQDESIIQTATITALVNFATSLLVTMVAGSANIDYAVLGDDGLVRAATGYLIRNIVGSQRSRKPGVGV